MIVTKLVFMTGLTFTLCYLVSEVSANIVNLDIKSTKPHSPSFNF